jgi:FAD/FMN-containing dehydrogenase
MAGVDPRYVEDASGYRGHADRVAVPSTAAEVSGIVREALHQGWPVTVAGAGTGVTGGRVAHGGIVISLERLRRLETGRGAARAGPGVLLKDLQAAAARTGQMYGPDPTEWTASVGGTIATNASGSRSFRYGATRAAVLGLEVVMMDGSTRWFRRGNRVDFELPEIPLPATTKNTAGYLLRPGMDWVDLITGSEGTLGIVTEAELRLVPAAENLFSGLVFFPGDTAAIGAVDAWRPVEGLRMLEYFDTNSLRLLRERVAEIPECAGAAILFERETARAAGDEAEEWYDRLYDAGALAAQSWFALSDADRERFRRFRHTLPEMVNEIVRRNGFTKLGSDYAVPVERNLEMLEFYRTRLEGEFAGRYVIFGHIGDAHVHANILPATQAEFDRGMAAMWDLARRAVELGGTVSAEHGLGKKKRHLLALQYPAASIEAMKAVKRRLDPHWLLGRGTLFNYDGE